MPYTQSDPANVGRAARSTRARYASSGKHCAAVGGTTYSRGSRNTFCTAYAASSKRGLLRVVVVVCARHFARNTTGFAPRLRSVRTRALHAGARLAGGEDLEIVALEQRFDVVCRAARSQRRTVATQSRGLREHVLARHGALVALAPEDTGGGGYRDETGAHDRQCCE